MGFGEIMNTINRKSREIQIRRIEKRLNVLAENYEKAKGECKEYRMESDEWLTSFLNEAQERRWFDNVTMVFQDYYSRIETKRQNTTLSRGPVTVSLRDHSAYYYDGSKFIFRKDQSNKDKSKNKDEDQSRNKDEIKAKDVDCIGMLEFIIEDLKDRSKDDSGCRELLNEAEELKKAYYERLDKVLSSFDKYYESTRGENVNSKNANNIRRKVPEVSVMARYFNSYIESKQNYEELVGKRNGILLVAQGIAEKNGLETSEDIRNIDGEGEKVKASDFLFPRMSDLQERIVESSNDISYRSLYERMVGEKDDGYDRVVNISGYPFLQRVVRNLLTQSYQRTRAAMEESIKTSCRIAGVRPAELGLNVDRIPEYDDKLPEQGDLIEKGGDEYYD